MLSVPERRSRAASRTGHVAVSDASQNGASMQVHDDAVQPRGLARRANARRALTAMPRGFHLLITAQFFSALADNALLIVAIALLQERGLPGWWAPLLKFSFTLSYVFLAPVVGVLADAIPKARLMAIMSGVKIVGAVLLVAGWHPVAAYAVVGFGAAAYAPAKYGLVTEIVGAPRLVAANGWIEVSVVCAALLGTVLGGLLVADVVVGSDASRATQVWLAGLAGLGAFGAGAASMFGLSTVVLLAVYAFAGVLNLGVRDSGARYPTARVHVLALQRDFAAANRTLWRDADGGLSLAVTTIFWGVGATLQFAVLRWASDVLALPLAQAAYLQVAVAVGVVIGATLAGRWVGLGQAKRVLPAGVVLGLLMPVIAATDSLVVALPLLVAVGVVGGVLVVPLNALLQHRGHALLTAGRSIAVQGFNENLSILVMLSAYAAMLALDVPIVPLMSGFGLVVAAAVGALIWRERVSARRLAVP
jgi:MFS family permease